MTTHPLHFPVISFLKKTTKNDKSAQEGSRWEVGEYVQTRRSATHRSYFRISHSAEEAASHHPQMRRIIADAFEPRDVNRLRARRQEMEKEALVTAAKRSSVLIFPQLLRHFIFLFSSPPDPTHPSLTHYTLRNRHDGETCDTNWKPLGV